MSSSIIFFSVNDTISHPSTAFSFSLTIRYGYNNCFVRTSYSVNCLRPKIMTPFHHALFNIQVVDWYPSIIIFCSCFISVIVILKKKLAKSHSGERRFILPHSSSLQPIIEEKLHLQQLETAGHTSTVKSREKQVHLCSRVCSQLDCSTLYRSVSPAL